MVACTNTMMEETKGLGQRGVKGDTNDFFLTVDLPQIFWLNMRWFLVHTWFLKLKPIQKVLLMIPLII